MTTTEDKPEKPPYSLESISSLQDEFNNNGDDSAFPSYKSLDEDSSVDSFDVKSMHHTANVANNSERGRRDRRTIALPSQRRIEKLSTYADPTTRAVTKKIGMTKPNEINGPITTRHVANGLILISPVINPTSSNLGVLPLMYIYFSFSYALLFFFWASNIRNIRLGRDHNIWASREGEMSRPVVYAIHHLMTLLLGLKTITVFFEAMRYYFIRIHGHAEFLSTVYYGMSFVKGIFMFTVILLIGSGWSLIKPVLGDNEKKIIWAVLVLQVIDNIAVAVLSQETEGEKLYDDWSAVLHFVDILCCTAILVPIVWQVNSLEAIVQSKTGSPGNEVSGDESKPSVITDIESEVPASAETARTLQKLKQFQRFYMLVVAYIYFTRIVVYLFATMLGYRLTWLQYFVTELGTLVFYSVVGILFRPMVDNPYLEVSGTNDEEEMIEIART